MAQRSPVPAAVGSRLGSPNTLSVADLADVKGATAPLRTAGASRAEGPGLAAGALAAFGESFGLDPVGNARKIAELRSHARAVA